MKNTFCIFTEVLHQELLFKKPDFISKSKSQYFFSEIGVYRQSDHWGRTANSKWRLIPFDDENRKLKTGFAPWSNFHKDNYQDKLYFIEADFSKNGVYFNHKNNIDTDSKAILRTSTETTKIIRQIRNLMQNDGWTKYFTQEDIKKKIITDLINSEQSLVNIKNKYLNDHNF